MVGTKLCIGCMEETPAAAVCPRCDTQEETLARSPLFLPPRTLLNRQYLVGRVLGHGGFGVTYLAFDMNLNHKVAIKEYLPNVFATRQPGSHDVSAYSGEARSHFEYGLERFIEEARALARFQNNPGIPTVLNYFRANGTAYIVMSYVEGKTFKQYLAERGGRVPFDETRALLLPVMDALAEVHRAGMAHRDISPDNLYITAEGHVKLIDFGAAKHATGEHSQSLSVILKPGYAPEEQYRSRGRQGPWTDVYALGATFYRAITGQTPPQALDRLEADPLVRPSQMGVFIPPPMEMALLKALAVRAEDRYRDVASFRQALAPQLGVTEVIPGPPVKVVRRGGRGWMVAALFLLLVALGLGVGWGVTYNQVAADLRYYKGRTSDLYSEKSRLEEDLKKALADKGKLASTHPERQLSINEVRLRNKDQSGSIKFPTEYGQFNGTPRFRKDDIRYIGFYLDIQNNWEGYKAPEGDLGIKYYEKGATRPREGKESKDGNTFYFPVSKALAGEFIGWGKPESSTYDAGTTYRIEFWYAGKKIKEVEFEVYE